MEGFDKSEKKDIIKEERKRNYIGIANLIVTALMTIGIFLINRQTTQQSNQQQASSLYASNLLVSQQTFQTVNALTSSTSFYGGSSIDTKIFCSIAFPIDFTVSPPLYIKLYASNNEVGIKDVPEFPVVDVNGENCYEFDPKVTVNSSYIEIGYIYWCNHMNDPQPFNRIKFGGAFLESYSSSFLDLPIEANIVNTYVTSVCINYVK